MLNDTFLKNKIKRQINQNGSEFSFSRFKKDEYGQTTKEIENVYKINGILHQEMIRVQMSEMDKAKVVDVPRTSILCLYEDGFIARNEDEVIISDLRYKVIDKVNLNSFNVAFEISLEMIKDENEI